MNAVTKPEPYPCDKRESCARPCPRALNGLGYEVLTLKPEGYRNLSGIVFPNFCRANDVRIAGAEEGATHMTYEALDHPSIRRPL